MKSMLLGGRRDLILSDWESRPSGSSGSCDPHKTQPARPAAVSPPAYLGLISLCTGDKQRPHQHTGGHRTELEAQSLEADSPAHLGQAAVLAEPQCPHMSGGRARAPACRAAVRGSQLSAWCREASGNTAAPPRPLHWAVSIPQGCVPAPCSSFPPGAPPGPHGQGGAQVGSDDSEPPAYLIQAGNEPRRRTGEAKALLDGGEAALEVGTVQELAELQEAMAEHEHLAEETLACEVSAQGAPAAHLGLPSWGFWGTEAQQPGLFPPLVLGHILHQAVLRVKSHHGYTCVLPADLLNAVSHSHHSTVIINGPVKPQGCRSTCPHPPTHSSRGKGLTYQPYAQGIQNLELFSDSTTVPEGCCSALPPVSYEG